MPLTFSSSPGSGSPGNISPGFAGLTLNPLAPLVRGASASMVAAVGTTTTVTNPGQPGDLILIYCAAVLYNTTFSCPGFTALPAASGGGGNGSCQLLWKPNVSDAAGTTYVVTASQADAWGALIASAGNQDQSLEFDASPTSGAVNNTAGTIVTAPGITTKLPSDLLLWFAFTLVPSGTPVIGLPGGYSAAMAQAYGTIPAVTNVSVMLGYSQSGAPGTILPVVGSVSPAEISGATLVSIPLPQYVRQPVKRPRHNIGLILQSLVRRLRRQASIIIQPTGVPFPLIIRQRRVPTPIARVHTRRRIYGPPAIQGTTSQAFPTVTRQQRRSTAGAALQLARLPRRRVQSPGNFPQGQLAPPWVPQNSPPRATRRLSFLRRPKGAQPPLKQGPQPGPVNPVVRRQRIALPQIMMQRRQRGFALPLPQGNQGQGTPPIMRPARYRLRAWALYRRHKVFLVPTPKQTQQATTAWTSGSAWHVTPPNVINVASATWKAPATWQAGAHLIRNATMTWTSGSGWKVIAGAQAFGHAAWTSASTWHVTGFKTRFGTGQWTSGSTLTAVAVRSRGGVWSSGSTMAIAPYATHPAAASWAASSVLTVTVAGRLAVEEILIAPLSVPGVNALPLQPPAVSLQPVTEAVITASIEDELFDS